MRKIKSVELSCEECTENLKYIGVYRQIWNWIKATFLTLALSIILSASILNVTLTFVSIKMNDDKMKYFKDILQNLSFRLFKNSLRWNYEVTAKQDLKRSLLWQKIDIVNKKTELKYRKSWQFKRFIRQNGLSGIFDDRWD